VRLGFSDAPKYIMANKLEFDMLGIVARWGHNVLLTSTGLLTLAVVYLFTK